MRSRDLLSPGPSSWRRLGARRFYLVSVFPEMWRERRMDDDLEHDKVETKKAEVEFVPTDLDWVILRPSEMMMSIAIRSTQTGGRDVLKVQSITEEGGVWLRFGSGRRRLASIALTVT